jgi:predicted  nucleic acid-binding Zn-ribbon protein
MAIRTILGFTRDLADLRPKLSKIESTLDRIRDRMKDNKELVGTLSKEVAQIEDLEGKMRAHYEAIQEQEREAEKKNIEAEEDEQSGRKRRIQRKKMGFGEDGNEELA